MKKLPIGIQDFRELREGGYVYVDKTEYIHKLVTEGKYYFLSRPHHFGKSLLVNTLAELFQGSRELFEGLWIEEQWDWEQRNPVIKLDFSSMEYKDIGLKKAISARIDEIATAYQVELKDKSHGLRFQELVQKISKKHGSPVILIDEDDKPIIDHLEELPKAKANLDVLDALYSGLKDLDAYTHLVFITGTYKFSRSSIFSGLNNLSDITRHYKFQSMLGYTQEELEHSFADRIEMLSDKFGGKHALLEGLRDWYNGYAWNKKQITLYNPFSVLSFFQTEDFDNFWFASGMPTFLVNLLKKYDLRDLEGLEVAGSVFDGFDINNIPPSSLLFQAGCITIKEEMGFGLYRLGYPNREVRQSMIIPT